MILPKIIIAAWYLSFLSVTACSEHYRSPHAMLNTLTLDQKIGQLFVVTAIPENDANKEIILNKGYRTDKDYVKHLISTYHVGGVIFLCSNTCEKQVALTQEFQQASTLPLLIAQDLEWGLTMRLTDALRFPRNQALGALSSENDHLIYNMGYEIGKQCRSLGVHMNLAPVVDVNNNPDNPVINDRSFGENKERVAKKGLLFMRGLQDAGIIACAKHFPGHGDTHVDSHYDLPCIQHSQKHLHDCELYPFKRMIKGGIKAIMSAHLEIPLLEPQENLPSSLSHRVTTNLLKQELGFAGIIITDGLDMKGVTRHHAPGKLELQAIKAGNDILLCSSNVPEAIAAIKQAIQDGTLSEEELNKRVAKILALKAWAGCTSTVPDVNAEQLHSLEARSLKQQLYSNAITVARDDAHLVPITPDKAPDVACLQIGQEGIPSHFTKTITQELSAPVSFLPASTNAQTVKKVIAQIHHDTVIISLLGMTRAAQEQFGISPSTLYCLAELKKAGKKVVIVVFGNAYSLPLMKDASAVIIAYEDDIDAQEVAAQVIIGTRKATGTLPVLNSDQAGIPIDNIPLRDTL